MARRKLTEEEKEKLEKYLSPNGSSEIAPWPEGIYIGWARGYGLEPKYASKKEPVSCEGQCGIPGCRRVFNGGKALGGHISGTRKALRRGRPLVFPGPTATSIQERNEE